MVSAERQPKHLEPEPFIVYGVPFYFDPEINMFVANDRKISPVNFQKINKINVQNIDIDSKAEDGIVMTMLGLVQLPNSRRALSRIYDNERTKNAASQKIEEAMKLAFIQAAPEIELAEIDSDFFKARISPRGTFRLETVGVWACLQPDYTSNAVAPTDILSDKFSPVAYSMHKIEHSAMEASLLAGAGTVAWITKNS